MSEENVALLRGLYDQWSQGDLRPGEEIYAEGAVFEPLGIIAGEKTLDFDGFRRAMRDFLEQWDGFALEPQEFVDLGETVLVKERQWATGRGSGMEIEQTFYAVWTFRGGRVISVRWKPDLESARRVAEQVD